MYRKFRDKDGSDQYQWRSKKSIASWFPWGHHQMETFSALLAICAGNSPVTGEFHTQRPVTRSFDVLFDLHLNEWLSKQSRDDWWFETPPRPLWRHCNDIYFHISIVVLQHLLMHVFVDETGLPRLTQLLFFGAKCHHLEKILIYTFHTPCNNSQSIYACSVLKDANKRKLSVQATANWCIFQMSRTKWLTKVPLWCFYFPISSQFISERYLLNCYNLHVKLW